jgi:hypothetical protein
MSRYKEVKAKEEIKKWENYFEINIKVLSL